MRNVLKQVLHGLSGVGRVMQDRTDRRLTSLPSSELKARSDTLHVLSHVPLTAKRLHELTVMCHELQRRREQGQ